jgi:nitroreductase
VQDGAAATENMLLVAHALGLGACWISVYGMEFEGAGKRILGISEDKRLLLVISAGYPAETPRKERKALEGITYTNRYGLHAR